MNRTRDLLYRPAGGVESKKNSRSSSTNNNNNNSDGNHHSSSTSPRKSSQDSGSHHNSRGSGNEEGQKWKQRLTDNKLFKRLLQPTHVGMDKNTSGHRGGSNGNSGSYETSSSSRDGTVVPRLGEVPARSKYFRPEQQNSHFANTADYLPLAEMCGPPVQSANTYSTHNEADDTDRAEARHRRASDEEGSPTTPRHTKKHRSRSSRKRRHRHRAHRESHDAEAPYDGMEEAYEAPTDFDEDANFSDEGEESEEGDETTDDDDNDGDEERNHFHHGADADGAEVAYEGDGDQDVDFGFDEAEDEGHYNHPALQQQQQQQQQSGRPEESGLREKFVRAIPGSVQRRQYGSSTGSATSAASSVGPTGLALMPQFRWVPRPGGGGHGFNPFMAYRRPLPQQQQQQQRYYTSDQRASPANLPSPSHPTDHRAVSPVSPFHPPSQQQQEEDGKLTANLSSVGARHSSFDMFYGTPSPSPQQRDAASPMYNSFYGPIGTLGIEASRRRRQLELEHGSAGDAEKAYKARTSRRSSRFDDGSILLITKAWCDPEMLLSARVVDSPRLPADIDEDDEDGGGSAANMMDWDDDSDDAAAMVNDDNKNSNNNNNNNNANKPPVYDAATMAAREARVRKERIRQEKLRSQTADSPSFYFAGAELAGLKVPPPDESTARKSTPASPVGAGRGAATPRAAAGAGAAPLPAAPSPPAHARGSPPSVMTGVAASKASPLKESNDKHDHDIDDEARSYSSSSSSKSSDNGNNSSGDDEEDEDDDDDSNSNSDSDSRSDNSSNSESDNETDYAESDAGGRSPRDDSITRAPAHGAKKGRAPPRHRRSSSSGHGHAPDVSISAGPGVTIGRSVVGEPGQYDFMNSSMIDGPGGSLFFPHDDNEGSVVATALPAPLTPFNRPGNAYTPIHGANNSSSDRAGPPVYTNSITTLHNATTTAMATAAAPPKSATSNVLSPVANPTVAGGKDRDPLTERPASGNGVTAANALREMKRVKKVATDTRAGTGTQQQQQQQQQRGVQNASATGEDGGAAGMSAYGSSFHLKDGRPLYTPADEGEVVPGSAPYSPALPDSRATTQSPQRSTPGQRRSSDAYGTAGGAAASPKLTTPKSAASAPASMVGASAGAATAGHGTNANRRGSTTSPGDYMMSIRDIPPTPDVHANRRPSESPVGFSTSTAFRGPSTTPAVHNININNTSGQAEGNAPSRNPTVSPSLYSTTSTNGAARRTSTTSPAGISVSTAGGYNTRPSSLAPAISPPHGPSASRPVSLTPQPPTDGRRFSHGGGGVPSTNFNNYHSSNARVDLTLSAKPAAAGWPATTSPTAGGGGYYAPMTPPGTPKNTTATRGVRENAAAASPVGRVSANKSVTPGLGESTNFNDHGYELPGM